MHEQWQAVQCDTRRWYVHTQVPIYASYLHDAVSVYASALEQVRRHNATDVSNGTAIMSHIRGTVYQSELTTTFRWQVSRFYVRTFRNNIQTSRGFSAMVELLVTYCYIIDCSTSVIRSKDVEWRQVVATMNQAFDSYNY